MLSLSFDRVRCEITALSSQSSCVGSRGRGVKTAENKYLSMQLLGRVFPFLPLLCVLKTSLLCISFLQLNRTLGGGWED